MSSRRGQVLSTSDQFRQSILNRLILLFHYLTDYLYVKLVHPHSTEECANSMQFYVEEFVEKTGEMQSVARRAYISFMRSYAGYSREWKSIFNLKNLHLGHVAKSFGLREAPREIAGKEIKLFKGSRTDNGDSGNKRTRDGLESKHARDLKRLANNHREYGNVVKKEKQRSQQATLDLR